MALLRFFSVSTAFQTTTTGTTQENRIKKERKKQEQNFFRFFCTRGEKGTGGKSQVSTVLDQR